MLRSFFNPNTTAAKDLSTLDGLVLSPNPATTTIEIRLDSGPVSRIEILDQTGRRVFAQENIDQGRVQISLTQVPPGLYFARVFDQQNRVATRKVVKL
ncbi:MAG: T9SS type A sorting domain-containing protein [Lewinellaceae bacterium]|nr:T9SS type A sorting domain-containing protein [Lewinellaceae bacterium]